MQINTASYDGSQFVLHPYEGKAHPDAGQKFDQHIKIAIRRKIIAQDGTKKRQSANAVRATKCRNLTFRYFDIMYFHVFVKITKRACQIQIKQ